MAPRTRTAVSAVAQLAVLAAMSPAAAQPLPRLNVNMSEISVSGVSSGGAFSIQFHVSHSRSIMGNGVFAGPPYWCANGNAVTAQTNCMRFPSLISVTELIAATDYAELTLSSIDNTKYLASDRVWIFTGEKDTVVHPGVVNKTREYYEHYMTRGEDMYLNSYPAEHAWITDSWGNLCGNLGPPYINNCNFDAAGSMLQHIYQHSLKARADGLRPENIFKFDQRLYTPLKVTAALLSMNDTGRQRWLRLHSGRLPAKRDVQAACCVSRMRADA